VNRVDVFGVAFWRERHAVIGRRLACFSLFPYFG